MEEQIKQTNPTLHRYLFTVTTFSKILAMLLFILLPFVGFYLGIQYQQKVTIPPVASEVQKTVILAPTLTPKAVNSPIPTTTPTTIDTSNWKTYTNTKVGFSIKYPNRYPQPGLPSGAPTAPTLYANGTEVKTAIIFGTAFNDSYELIPVPYGSTLDDFLKAEQEHLSKDDASFMGVWYGATPKTLVKKIFINDKISYAFLYNTSEEGYEEAHVLLPNQYVLVFTTDGQINKDEFEAAIKSLKLIQ